MFFGIWKRQDCVHIIVILTCFLVHIVHISYTPRNQLTCVAKVITDDCLIGLLCVEPQTQFIKLFSLTLMNHAPAAGSFLPSHLQQLNL